MPKLGLDPIRATQQRLIWCEWRATEGGRLDEPVNARMAQEIQDLRHRLAVLRENNTPKTPQKQGG